MPSLNLKRICVVGNGIIGATISKVLKERAIVTTIDAKLSDAGTPPSGGHLKPSWFGSLPKEQYIPAMDLLDRMWSLHSSDFKVWPTGIKTTVYRVDTDLVVCNPCITGNVTEIVHTSLGVSVTYVNETGERRSIFDHVIVCTGHWAESFVGDIQKKRGVSFRVNTILDCPFIKPWAPYKQIVAHQQTPNEIWIGDGTAILDKNWNDETFQRCQNRCLSAINRTTVKRRMTGIRAYIAPIRKGEPVHYNRLGDNLWVVTGAAKSGTIGAGWAALRVLEDLKLV